MRKYRRYPSLNNVSDLLNFQVFVPGFVTFFVWKREGNKKTVLTAKEKP